MQDQIKLLNISDRIYEKYRCLVRNNINCTKEECRKKLTRDFILGSERCSDYNFRYIIRNYGKLFISVDMDTLNIIDITNRKCKPSSIFINPREKEDLNKLMKI